jgi:hypothetical protein
MKAYWGVKVWLHAFFTSAIDGGEWSASHPGLFTPREKARYPLDRRPGGLQGRLRRGGEEKNSQLLPVFKPPIIQTVSQCYTD